MRIRDYGTTRGYPNESEYTVVKVRRPLAGTRTALTLGSGRLLQQHKDLSFRIDQHRYEVT